MCYCLCGQFSLTLSEILDRNDEEDVSGAISHYDFSKRAPAAQPSSNKPPAAQFEATTSGTARPPVKLNRRKSIPMDMTECVSDILGTLAETSVREDEDAYVAPTLASQQSSKRRSVAMDMTECVGDLIKKMDEQSAQTVPTASCEPEMASNIKRRRSVAMDMTENIGQLLADYGAQSSNESYANIDGAQNDSRISDGANDSFGMEMTECVGKVLQAQQQQEQQQEYAEVPVRAARSVASRRKSVGMDMTECVGDILRNAAEMADAASDDASDDGMEMTECVSKLLESVPAIQDSVCDTSVASVGMEMTTCVGDILSNAASMNASPVETTEATKPSRKSFAMDMTECVGTVLESAGAARLDMEPQARPKPARKSVGMDMTTCVGDVLAANNLLSPEAPSDSAGATTKPGRKSIGMDMTTCVGDVLAANNLLSPVSNADPSDRRESIGMEMTTCVGDLLAESNVPGPASVPAPNTRPARKSIGMDMTTCVGDLLAESNMPSPASEPALSTRPARKSIGMDMTTCVGDLLAEINMPEPASEHAALKRPRESIGMDMTSCVSEVLNQVDANESLQQENELLGDQKRRKSVGMEMTQCVEGVLSSALNDTGVAALTDAGTPEHNVIAANISTSGTQKMSASGKQQETESASVPHGVKLAPAEPGWSSLASQAAMPNSPNWSVLLDKTTDELTCNGSSFDVIGTAPRTLTTMTIASTDSTPFTITTPDTVVEQKDSKLAAFTSASLARTPVSAVTASGTQHIDATLFASTTSPPAVPSIPTDSTELAFSTKTTLVRTPSAAFAVPTDSGNESSFSTDANITRTPPAVVNAPTETEAAFSTTNALRHTPPAVTNDASISAKSVFSTRVTLARTPPGQSAGTQYVAQQVSPEQMEHAPSPIADVLSVTETQADALALPLVQHGDQATVQDAVAESPVNLTVSTASQAMAALSPEMQIEEAEPVQAEMPVDIAEAPNQTTDENRILLSEFLSSARVRFLDKVTSKRRTTMLGRYLFPLYVCV